MYLDHLKTRAALFGQSSFTVDYSEILESSVEAEVMGSDFDQAVLKMEFCQKIGSEGFGDAAASAAEKVKDIILKLIEIAVSILAKVKDFIVAVFKKIFEFISSIISFILEKIGVSSGGGNGLSQVQAEVQKETNPATKFKIIANYLKSVKLANPKGKIYSFETTDINKIAEEGLKESAENLDSATASALKGAIVGLYKNERIDKSKVNKKITDDLQAYKNSCQRLAESAKRALKEIDTNTIKREAEQNSDETDKMAAYKAALSVTIRLNKFVGRISRESVKAGSHAAKVYAKMRMPKGSTGDCELVFFDFKKFIEDYISPSFDLIAKAKETTSQYISSLRGSNVNYKEKLEGFRDKIVEILHEDYTKAPTVGNESGLSSILKVGGAIGGAIAGLAVICQLASALASAPYDVQMDDFEIRHAHKVMEKIEDIETSLHNQAYVMVQMANLLDGSNVREGSDFPIETPVYHTQSEHGSSFVYGTPNPDHVNGGMVKVAMKSVKAEIEQYKSLMDSTWSNPLKGEPGKAMTTKSFRNSVDRFSPAELDSLSKLVDEAESAYNHALQQARK